MGSSVFFFVFFFAATLSTTLLSLKPTDNTHTELTQKPIEPRSPATQRFFVVNNFVYQVPDTAASSVVVDLSVVPGNIVEKHPLLKPIVCSFSFSSV